MALGLGRTYSVVFNNVTIAAKQDFFYVKPAADKIALIEAIYLSNVAGATNAGDANERLYDVRLIRLPATVTAGSGGTAPTPNPLSTNDTAAGFTGRVNDTTVATTSGTALTLHSDGWNDRVPYAYYPAPEHRVIVANAQAVVFRLETTPASVVCNGTIVVRELP